jgi:hypothetical protein
VSRLEQLGGNQQATKLASLVTNSVAQNAWVSSLAAQRVSNRMAFMRNHQFLSVRPKLV